MKHRTRSHVPTDGPTPPVGAWAWCTRAVRAGADLLSRSGPLNRRAPARFIAYFALVLGLIVQGVLLLTAAYLVDLSLSLMELWAQLAAQHLRLTL